MSAVILSFPPLLSLRTSIDLESELSQFPQTIHKQALERAQRHVRRGMNPDDAASLALKWARCADHGPEAA